MRETLRNTLIAIAILIVTICSMYAGIQLNKTVSKWEKEVEREVFKETTTYNEAAASFLADSYKQYNDAESDKDRNSIMEYIVMRYPNLDYNNIDNKTLREFYRDCLNR